MDSDPIAEDASDINSLPDALLGLIISRLEPSERVGVEAVSKRWHNSSRQYGWCGQTLLHQSMFWGYEAGLVAKYGLSLRKEREIIRRRVKCLFVRCSSFLREVWLGVSVCKCLDEDALDLITTAGNLTALKLDAFPLTFAMADLIGQRLTKLERLDLTSCFERSRPSEADRALTAILEGCRSLRELALSHNAMSGETSFAHLPPTLRSLDIASCYELQVSAIDHLRAACVQGQLRELNLTRHPIDGPFMAMGRLFEELPLLEKLVYKDGSVQTTARPQDRLAASAAMTKISSMKMLKSLDLESNLLVTDEVLRAIADNCEELEELLLYDAHGGAFRPINCSSVGIRLLARLPKLTSLMTENMRGLNHEVLLAVVASGKLRKSSLRGFPMITDTTIQHVLERCGRVRQLDVSQRRGITRATVKTIGEFVAGISIKSQSTAAQLRPGELEVELKTIPTVLKSIPHCDEFVYDQLGCKVGL